MTKYKYSKSSNFYLETKKDFFSKNSKLLNRVKNYNDIYSAQPLRKLCKLCKTKLLKQADLTSHGVDYKFCPNCLHLNGNFEETEEFIKNLYLLDGTEYSSNYIDENFRKRAKEIYIPKLNFLLENIELKNRQLLDVGCGSGYFVYSSIAAGYKAKGIDVNTTMIEFGNNQIFNETRQKPLIHVKEEDFYDYISNTKADVISAIGVIEHLRELDLFFEAFKESKASFLLYSVPMFSFSAIIESILEDVFPRQLGGAHTHLFTESSIKQMHKILDVNPIAEWRFGTDIMDLYRSVRTLLTSKKVSDVVTDMFHEGFFKELDRLQSVLDENHFCSEIHCVVSKK